MTTKPRANDAFFKHDPTQMAFSVLGSRHLNISVDTPADKTSEFLAHLIARKPMDLIVHVQRINLAIRHHLDEFLYGALLDLNIALGSRGYGLRKHMLDRAAERLDIESVRHLQDSLDKGITASDVIPKPGVTMLSKGIASDLAFLK